MTDYKTETKLFSGYRKRFLTDATQYAYAMADLKKRVAQYAQLMAVALTEPLFVDDNLKHLDPANILQHGLEDGELFVCLQEDFPAGLIYLTKIDGRSAEIEAWAQKPWRQFYKGRKVLSLFAHEVIDYAFRPFGDPANGGLGLTKIKARIAATNLPAIRAAVALGFRVYGCSPLDGCYNSQPVDILNMELLNPAYFQLAAPEVIKRVEGKNPNTAGLHTATELPDSSTLPGTTQSSDGGATSLDGATGNATRRRGRSKAPGVAAVEQPAKPARPRRKSSA